MADDTQTTDDDTEAEAEAGAVDVAPPDRAVNDQLEITGLKALKTYLNANKDRYDTKEDIAVDANRLDPAFEDAFEKAVNWHARNNNAPLSSFPLIDYQARLLRYRHALDAAPFKPVPDPSNKDVLMAQAHSVITIENALLHNIETLKNIEFSEDKLKELKDIHQILVDPKTWADNLDRIKSGIRQDGILDASTRSALPYLIAAINSDQTKDVMNRLGYSINFLNFMNETDQTYPGTTKMLNDLIASADLGTLTPGTVGGSPDSTPATVEVRKADPRETPLGSMIPVPKREAAGVIMAGQAALGFKRADDVKTPTDAAKKIISMEDWGDLSGGRGSEERKDDITIKALRARFAADYLGSKVEIAGLSRKNLKPEAVTDKQIMDFYIDLYTQESKAQSGLRKKLLQAEIDHESALRHTTETLSSANADEATQTAFIASLQNGELQKLGFSEDVSKTGLTVEDLKKTEFFKSIPDKQGVNKSDIADAMWLLLQVPMVTSHITPPSAEGMFGVDLGQKQERLKEILALAGLASFNAEDRVPEHLITNDPDNVHALYRATKYDDRIFSPAVYDSLNSRGEVDAFFLINDPQLKPAIETLQKAGKLDANLKEGDMLSREDVGKIAQIRINDIAKNFGVTSTKELLGAITEGKYVPNPVDLDLSLFGFGKFDPSRASPGLVEDFNNHKQYLAENGMDINDPVRMENWHDMFRDELWTQTYGELPEKLAFRLGQRVFAFDKYGINSHEDVTLEQAREALKGKPDELAAFNREIKNLQGESIVGYARMDTADPIHPFNLAMDLKKWHLQFLDKDSTKTTFDKMVDMGIPRTADARPAEIKTEDGTEDGKVTDATTPKTPLTVEETYTHLSKVTELLINTLMDKTTTEKKLLDLEDAYLEEIEKNYPELLSGLIEESVKSKTALPPKEFEEELALILDDIKPALSRELREDLFNNLIQMDEIYGRRHGRFRDVSANLAEQNKKLEECLEAGNEMCAPSQELLTVAAATRPAPATPEQAPGNPSN